MTDIGTEIWEKYICQVCRHSVHDTERCTLCFGKCQPYKEDEDEDEIDYWDFVDYD